MKRSLKILCTVVGMSFGSCSWATSIFKFNLSIDTQSTVTNVAKKKFDPVYFKTLGVYEDRLIVSVDVPHEFDLYDTGIKSLVFYRSSKGTDGKEKGDFYPLAGVKWDGLMLKHKDSHMFLSSLRSTLNVKYQVRKYDLFAPYLKMSNHSAYFYSLNQELYSLGEYLKSEFIKYADIDAKLIKYVHNKKVKKINSEKINKEIRKAFLDDDLQDCIYEEEHGMWYDPDSKMYMAD